MAIGFIYGKETNKNDLKSTLYKEQALFCYFSFFLTLPIDTNYDNIKEEWIKDRPKNRFQSENYPQGTAFSIDNRQAAGSV